MKKIAIIELKDNLYKGNPKEEGICEWADWYIFDELDEETYLDLSEHYDLVLVPFSCPMAP